MEHHQALPSSSTFTSDSPLQRRKVLSLAVAVLAVSAGIATSSATGAHAASAPVIDGAIGALYKSSPAARSQLKQATSTRKNVTVAGVAAQQQKFAGGEIVWTEKTGAVWMANGPVLTYWNKNKGLAGPLGAPSEQGTVLAGNGALQRFTGGVITSYPSTGVRAVNNPIGSRWLAIGAQIGILGYPSADEVSTASGRVQKFQKGEMFWAKDSGANPMTDGTIRTLWRSLGAEKGILGYPKSGKYDFKDGIMQKFAGGAIFYSGAKGTHALTGKIAERWGYLAGTTSSIGIPAGPQVKVPGGLSQMFTGGYLVWSEKHGVRRVDSNTYPIWLANVATYGMPTKESWTDKRGVRNEFQHVKTVWDLKTKQLYSASEVGQGMAVVIGDSQLTGDSWVEQGARANGFKVFEMGYGGWGYTRTVASTGGTPDKVYASNRLLLPQGNPDAVILTLGGNDATSKASDAKITAGANATWRELRRKYPHARIVVNGVMSHGSESHAQRIHVDKLLAKVAKNSEVIYVPVAGLATDAGAEKLYKDASHLSQAGHNKVAPFYAARLKSRIG